MLPAPFHRANRPIVLGHRGVPPERPENTLESFELALAHGADGVELDVMRCGSGEVVVIHDVKLKRLAGRPGLVRKTPWAQLKTFDVGSHLGSAFASARVPLLRDVLEQLPAQTLVNIELKGERIPDLELARQVALILSQQKHPERFVVSSFAPALVRFMRWAAPKVAAGYLFDRHKPLGVRTATLLGAQALHVHWKLATQSRVLRWRARGFGVAVWTLDDPKLALALYRRGVDVVISNRPKAICDAFGAPARELQSNG